MGNLGQAGRHVKGARKRQQEITHMQMAIWSAHRRLVSIAIGTLFMFGITWAAIGRLFGWW